MPTYVVAIQPEDKLFKKIKKIKQQVKNIVGDQDYLRDDPHLTLYIGEFTNFRKWDNEFTEFVKELKVIKSELAGWYIFDKDPITGKKTICVEIIKDKKLSEIQKKIIKLLSSYRKNNIPQRYKKVYTNLKPIFKKNIDKFGFPFVGSIWIPHLNVASFTNNAFDDVWEFLKSKKLTGEYILQKIVIYELKQEKIEEVKVFPLI